MGTILQDVRIALRRLVRTPGFTVACILSLALGIGANTTVFSLINAVFLLSLPIRDEARVVSVFTTDEKNSGGLLNLLPTSIPNYKDYRDESDAFSSLATTMGAGVNVAGTGGEPERVFGLLVTGNYFDMLGVKFARGRGFTPDEDRTPGASPVVVLTDRFWKRRFAADPGLVGSQVSLNGRKFTVVGIAPEGFRGTGALGGPDLFLPSMMYADFLQDATWYSQRRPLISFVLGRLKDGVTAEQAEASLKTIAARLEKEYPDANLKRSVRVVPIAQAAINPNQRDLFVRAGGLLMTVVGLVLLIACANIANLLLGRAVDRRKEIAIRISLGASRGRLVRQLLTESVILSIAGGAAGLAVAVWGSDLLLSFRPPFLNAADLDLTLDSRVLLFTLGLSILTGLVFGLAPAIRASRPEIVTDLKERSSLAGGHGSPFTLRSLLVTAQVALSMVALVGAALFLRSLGQAQEIDLGFETEHMGVLSFDVDGQHYGRPRGEEFQRRVLETVRALPGVASATLGANAPLAGGFMRTVFPEGMQDDPARTGILVLTDSVMTGYFDTLKIPILRGRDFTEADRDGAPLVVIVNDTMAERFWPGADPIGKRFKFHGDTEFREVVGVARTSKYIAVGEDPRPFAYVPIRQLYAGAVTLYVRSAGDPAPALGDARRAIQAMDGDLPIVAVSTMSALVEQGFWAARMGAGLLAIFGGLALILASIGIYGVMSWTVGQRTREIGIRMAMGAEPADVLKLVLWQGMVPVLMGVAAGLAIALASARLVSGLLFGVSAADPATFALVPAVLAAVAVLASWLPARRATRIDPLVALRYE